jgi:hypothetical protein
MKSKAEAKAEAEAEAAKTAPVSEVALSQTLIKLDVDNLDAVEKQVSGRMNFTCKIEEKAVEDN